MTVGELIKELEKYPKDMVVACEYDVFSGVDVTIKEWTHNNYPYDKPSFKFVNIE